MKPRWILLAQIAIVVVLCVTSLWLLWSAGAAVVARTQNRQRIQQRLVQTEVDLSRAGAAGLSLVPPWPENLGPDEWAALDVWLGDAVTAALHQSDNRFDGGYYLVGFSRFAGRPLDPSSFSSRQHATLSGPRREVRALVEAQIQQALDEDRAQSLLVEAAPHTLAIRAAPLWINGRQVAATWAIAVIDDAPALAAAVDRYRLSAALAVAGIGVGLLTALWLAQTVRRQSRERIRLEQQLNRSERLAALGKLVAGVAHEVRNPLAGIRSTAQLCERGIPFDAHSAGDLIAEVDRLDAIVGRLLQFARVGHEPLQRGNLNELVLEATRWIRPLAEEIGVHLEFNLDHSAPELPLASLAFVQAIRNLTLNALQAMPNGGLLTLSTVHHVARREMVVSVVDSGPGLDDRVLEHLFEPFFTTKADCTGLGLAIAREIALAHGGLLTAANRKDGRGAVFTLILPIGEGAPSTISPPPKPDRGEPWRDF